MSSQVVWSSPEWRALAAAWIDERLALVGSARSGEVEQARLRPWGTVLRAPTSHGPVWLKATGASTAFEVGLYRLLHRTAPDDVLAPIAADDAHAWVLLPDGGAPLGERLAGADLVDALATVMPRYGLLQRKLAAEVGELLTLGIPDMRPETMPARLDEALEVVADMAGRETFQRLTDVRGTFAGWCERVAGGPVPASLDHNDLHPYNILVANGEGLDSATFYDWGDSVVAHPFACMLQPLSWVGRQLGFGFDSPEVMRVRDAYLEVFGDLAPHAELVEQLELACHVGKAARALTWDRSLKGLGYEQAAEHATAPLACLEALLEDTYLGGA